MGRKAEAGAVSLGLALLLLVTTSAEAGVPGPTVSLGRIGTIEYLKATFDDVASQAGANANCDVGDFVTGGGGSISGPGATGALNASVASDVEGSGWLAEGSTTGITTRTVTTYAICGEEVTSWNQSTSNVQGAGQLGDFGPRTDFCAPAFTALGGVLGTGGDVRIVSTRPTDGGIAWSSTVQNFETQDALVSQLYECTTDYETNRRTGSAKVAGNAGSATARCKGSEAVIAGGFATTSQGEPERDTWATSTRPYDSKDKKKTPDDGWKAKVQNESDGKVKITAYALCAPK